MYQPLRWPDDAALQPRTLVRRVIWIPVLGWWIGAILDRHRLEPIRQSICSQLLARSPTPPEHWGVNPALASRVCKIIRDQMDWPNDHFLREDPINVLLSAGRDGLDGEEAILDCVSLAAKPLSRAERRGVYELRLGELIDRLAESAAA